MVRGEEGCGGERGGGCWCLVRGGEERRVWVYGEGRGGGGVLVFGKGGGGRKGVGVWWRKGVGVWWKGERVVRGGGGGVLVCGGGGGVLVCGGGEGGVKKVA